MGEFLLSIWTYFATNILKFPSIGREKRAYSFSSPVAFSLSVCYTISQTPQIIAISYFNESPNYS